MVVAASPSPAPHAAAGRPHPTYTKMITRALTDLGGSSPRPAIAHYILGRFTGLPASHDALLSAHLRRLLTEGVLRTHANGPSYILQEKQLGPRKDTSHASAPPMPVPVPVVGEKRGRGRPRKSPPAGIATPSLLPAAKRKHAQSPDDAVTKGKGGPWRQEFEHNWAFKNGGPVQSGGASSTGVKRGRGRPRKDKPPAAAAAAGSVVSPEPGNVAPSTGIKRGPGRPRKDKPSPAAVSPAAGSVASASRGFETGRGRPSLQKPSAAAAAAMSPESCNVAPSTGIKRGPGRPRKDKPSPAATSPTAGSVAASRGFKTGCGRPSLQEPSAATAAASCENGTAASMGIKTGGGTPRMDRPAGFEAGGGQSIMEKLAAAAMYDENGRDAASAGVQAGGGQSRFEKLAAVSAEGIKRGRGRPRKERPPASAAGVKRSRGRPRKHQSITGLVDAACEVLFREASTRREEDFVSAEKTQTKGVAHGDRKEASAADAGCVPVSGQNAATAPAGAIDSNLGPANLAGDVVSTGVKRGRGRPRKKKQAAAMSPETGDAASAGIEPGGGTPRMDESSAAMSAETRDAASRGVKRLRGRPRKEKPAAATATSVSTGVKRGRGRPMKVGSIGTWFAEAAAERALFAHMAEEAPGDSVSAGKTQAEGVAALRGREEARVADDAGRIPVSGERAATAPVEAGNGSDLGPASL